ncbi:hypothetical protein ALC60_14519 [Trachymyrmex zeteki]|uniref:Uncharacterized protein n=1 Tax=Mycetomoellerius zeteki TaxID=64791 RepID=A0A151WF06_9HYME|nr:hypothetical protein ALC60_14519 [Trachymyrmex zeteki]
MLSRGMEGVGRNTLGSLVTRGNQLCRYTMLTRPSGADVSAILGASGAAKMPFYEAADHAVLASLSSARPYIRCTARELMDRVRRCCTGEMFQPTRLKGQLTPSCLVACVEAAPSASYVPSFVWSLSLYRLPTTACQCPRSASYSRCAHSSFPPHFSGDSLCIPLPHTYNGLW